MDPERISEFWRELRDNAGDAYWWADHQILQAVLVAVAAGAIGLLFTYLEARVKVHVANGAVSIDG